MARKFTLGGKAPQIGCNVSHSHRKTKKAWMPNIQTKAMYSMVLGRSIRMTITTSTLRSVDFVGGLDNYLLAASDAELTKTMRDLRDLIRQKSASA
ncbi:MAG: 50S ribosomal protein L28 [Magnetococcales bacterium]|nr:50S ribosomal protein L28 [Magnetococcales bacterium]NGZ25553.1 50S ribosomal protein L28 [Magnetococcales bacterium]